jgi:hypothetical protein
VLLLVAVFVVALFDIFKNDRMIMMDFMLGKWSLSDRAE